MGRILVIDTNEKYCKELSGAVERIGHNLKFVNTFLAGLKELQTNLPDVVLLNASMPDGSGVDAILSLKQIPLSPEIIVLADTGDPDEAETAVKHGVWDYIERPPRANMLIPAITAVLRYKIKKTIQESQAYLEGKHFEGIIGESQQLKSCLELVARAANSDAHVLIKGETGTGKELIALAIHKNSPRADKNFVVVDCAALPEALVESTLLGYERGAFTGADKSQDGLIKQADGGTLFLDEVGELPVAVQKSFLRVLHERRFRPVGGKDEIESDFRLISASNRNLDEMVSKGEFREDLLFRIRSFTIELPSLRSRQEDIKSLVDYYAPKICERMGVQLKEISPEFFEALHKYQWPGNVRELLNALERSVVAARREPILLPQHLPTHLRVHLVRASVKGGEAKNTLNVSAGSGAANILPTLEAARDAAIERAEREYLQELLLAANGDMEKASKISNLSRSRLYVLLKRYKILY